MLSTCIRWPTELDDLIEDQDTFKTEIDNLAEMCDNGILSPLDVLGIALVADNEIVKRVDSGDLVITSDIPLASDVIEKKCLALNFRGELYTKENIKARLEMRNFMETLRNSGVETGGPPPLNHRDRHQFAAQLDIILNKIS